MTMGANTSVRGRRGIRHGSQVVAVGIGCVVAGPSATGLGASGLGRLGIFWGHQNHWPSTRASGITKSNRTTSMSNINPMQIVKPACPMLMTSLDSSASMVKAKTKAAVNTTPPELPIARIRPVLTPAPISSR